MWIEKFVFLHSLNSDTIHVFLSNDPRVRVKLALHVEPFGASIDSFQVGFPLNLVDQLPSRHAQKFRLTRGRSSRNDDMSKAYVTLSDY